MSKSKPKRSRKHCAACDARVAHVVDATTGGYVCTACGWYLAPTPASRVAVCTDRDPRTMAGSPTALD